MRSFLALCLLFLVSFQSFAQETKKAPCPSCSCMPGTCKCVDGQPCPAHFVSKDSKIAPVHSKTGWNQGLRVGDSYVENGVTYTIISIGTPMYQPIQQSAPISQSIYQPVYRQSMPVIQRPVYQQPLLFSPRSFFSNGGNCVGGT